MSQLNDGCDMLPFERVHVDLFIVVSSVVDCVGIYLIKGELCQQKGVQTYIKKKIPTRLLEINRGLRICWDSHSQARYHVRLSWRSKEIMCVSVLAWYFPYTSASNSYFSPLEVFFSHEHQGIFSQEEIQWKIQCSF